MQFKKIENKIEPLALAASVHIGPLCISGKLVEVTVFLTFSCINDYLQVS